MDETPKVMNVLLYEIFYKIRKKQYIIKVWNKIKLENLSCYAY